jgi:hypothetical protein
LRKKEKRETAKENVNHAKKKTPSLCAPIGERRTPEGGKKRGPTTTTTPAV